MMHVKEKMVVLDYINGEVAELLSWVIVYTQIWKSRTIFSTVYIHTLPQSTLAIATQKCSKISQITLPIAMNPPFK